MSLDKHSNAKCSQLLIALLTRDGKRSSSVFNKVIKRPSHGKLKLANPRWQTASKSWQTRSYTRQTPVKSQHTVICNMADLAQWHSRRTMEQKKRREETKSEKALDETQFVRHSSIFCLFVFSILVDNR